MRVPFCLMTVYSRPSSSIRKAKSSEVLTCYLEQLKQPPWTSYFVKYSSIENDQRGMSHFNWKVGSSNYHILRTGCYPYIKYHCTKRPFADLTGEDKFFRIIKLMNLGIPCLAYGIAAVFLIRHQEDVYTPNGRVTIYFLYEEDKAVMMVVSIITKQNKNQPPGKIVSCS